MEGLRFVFICTLFYTGLGFPIGFMDDPNDTSVLPLKSKSGLKSMEFPSHKDMDTSFPMETIKDDKETALDATQPKTSQIKIVTSSFTSSKSSSDSNVEKSAFLSKSHATSSSDGNTQLTQAESVAHTSETKVIDGRSENVQSSKEQKAVAVSNTDTDGNVKTLSAAVVDSAVSETIGGKTRHTRVNAKAVAEDVKDKTGEQETKVKTAAVAKVTKISNGKSETVKTLAAGESDQITHANGKIERKAKLAVLRPDYQKEKLTKQNDEDDNPKKTSDDQDQPDDDDDSEDDRKGSKSISKNKNNKYSEITTESATTEKRDSVRITKTKYLSDDSEDDNSEADPTTVKQTDKDSGETADDEESDSPTKKCLKSYNGNQESDDDNEENDDDNGATDDDNGGNDDDNGGNDDDSEGDDSEVPTSQTSSRQAGLTVTQSGSTSAN